MNYYFVTISFKDYIKEHVIDYIFPKLNIAHKQLLHKYLVDVVDIIAIKFNFSIKNRSIYEKQFTQNNNRDLIGLLYILLPYINDEADKSRLLTLNDIYIKKSTDSPKNINEKEPKYVYSNLQYGRCIRSKDGYEEIQFSEEHLKQNYILFKDTIQKVSNKLYINWLDVRPYDLLSYRNTPLYENTIPCVINRNFADWNVCKNDINGRNYKGLYVGDIYNTTINNLYHGIKNVKWMIYDIYYMEKEWMLSYIDIINIIFTDSTYGDLILPCLNGIEWNQLDDSMRDKFSQYWNNYVNAVKFGYNDKLPNYIISNVLLRLIYFFNKYYRQVNKAVKEDGYIKFNPKIEYDEDNLNQLKLASSDILKCALSIKVSHIYNYFKQCFDIFKDTWYSNLFIKNSANDNYKYDFIDKYDILTEKLDRHVPQRVYGILDKLPVWITAKNIYNFAKSLTHHIYNKQYIPFPKYWKSLTTENKNVILNRLNWRNENTVMSWFNIGGYIKRIYHIRNRNDIQRINIYLYDEIRIFFISIVFEALLVNGVLSTFNPNPQLTDKQKLPTGYKQRTEAIKSRLSKYLKNESNRDIWNNSYYYLTKCTYSDMDKITYKTGNSFVTGSYLDYLADEGDWTTIYAMDWIAQLSFYHRYLNNRIIYVTGSTGVGKSTQIPKLLLYSLKMIDYNYRGKIICSQPRIPPTKGNAETISEQLGVPILEYNESVDASLRTHNYYVQYEYSIKKHSKKVDSLMLDIVTDGTLYKKLQGSPILKRQLKNKYTCDNVYDIIIVDEAHEHNKNMDMILTMMKYATYYNNSIKLVIVSATMDEDEPNYRRYYRDINDNRMYPLNYLLPECKLDRINVDRRLHISPPGETTRYKIEEPNVDFVNKSEIDVVKDILNQTQSGDILLFEPGVKEIRDAIQELTPYLPPDVVAMEYHGQMSDSQKRKVEKREIQGYNRIIIVATNIAEASITLASLYYVVDTGSNKVMRFDYKTRSGELRLESISESSRIQRRGRVGRVADGVVYYMYDIAKTKYNRIKYDISISDISDNMCELLKFVKDRELFQHNPNDRNFSIGIDNLNTKFEFGLSVMTRNQYFSDNKFFNYYGDDSQYDYNNATVPHKCYQNGYSSNTLTDNDGTFYIIHPDELDIVRNLGGKITDVIESGPIVYKGNNKSVSYKMKTFWNILKERYFIILDDNKEYNKTPYADNIYRLMGDMEIRDVRYVISYLYSRKYLCTDAMEKLLPLYIWLYELVRGDVQNIFSESIIDGKIKALYGNRISDSYGFYTIFHKLFNFLSKHRSVSTRIDTIKEDKLVYIQNRNSKNYSKISPDKLDKLIEMDGKNMLSNSTLLTEKEQLYIDRNYEYDNIIIDPNIITQWASKNYLNGDVIIKYLKYYNNFKRLLVNVEKRNYDRDYDNTDKKITFKWFDNYLKTTYVDKYLYNNITRALLHGFGYNIVKRIDDVNLYLNINGPYPDNVYGLKMQPPKFKLVASLLDTSSTYGYMMYMGFKVNPKTTMTDIYLLHKITMNMLKTTILQNPKKYNYDPRIFKKMIHSTVNYYNNNIDDYQKIYLPEKQYITSNIVNKYVDTIKQIKRDMINNYNPTLWDQIDLNSFNSKNEQTNFIKFIQGHQTGGSFAPIELYVANQYYRALRTKKN